MVTPKTPTKPQANMAPKPAMQPQSAGAAPTATVSQEITRGVRAVAQKIVLYGPGGVGKTELCSLISQVGIEPAFVDIEEGSNFLDVARIDPTPHTLDETRQAVAVLSEQSSIGAIVIDSLTKAEEQAVAHTIANVPHEKGEKFKVVNSIEDYGFGKGYTHVYEAFLLLLQTLDAAARKGKHIIAVCHDCTANVPNPGGEDWIRYEPRLQSPASGKGSIRHRVKEWCDHLLYIGFDTDVSKDGKAIGSGSRTIYPTELPTHWAKSRSLSDQIVYERGSSTLWQLLFPRE